LQDVKKRMLGAGGTSVNGGAAAAMGGLRLSGSGGGGPAAAADGVKGAKKVPKQKGDPGANPRAFGFQSAGRAKASQARSAEKEQRRLHGECGARLTGQ
jgi:hypothetical protein